MHIRNLAAIIILLTVCVGLFQGCKPAPAANNAATPAVEAAKTDPPYPNKEPEKYQTEIWQTTAAGKDKFFVARDGAKWRIDSAYGAPNQVTTIHTDKDYVLAFATKVYAEYPIGHGFDEREDTINAMTRGMLNAKEKAAFEKAGDDGGLTKYKIISDAGKSVETLVYVDEKLGLPVKKEVYKTDGGQRVLDYSIQLSGFKSEVDASLFTLSKGFKQVSQDAMKKALTGAK